MSTVHLEGNRISVVKRLILNKEMSTGFPVNESKDIRGLTEQSFLNYWQRQEELLWNLWNFYSSVEVKHLDGWDFHFKRMHYINKVK